MEISPESAGVLDISEEGLGGVGSRRRLETCVCVIVNVFVTKIVVEEYCYTVGNMADSDIHALSVERSNAKSMDCRPTVDERI